MGIKSLGADSQVQIVLGEHSFFDKRSGLSLLIPQWVGRRCAILGLHGPQGASVKSEEFTSSVILTVNEFERCCSMQYSADLRLLNGTPYMNAMIFFGLFSTIFHSLPRLVSRRCFGSFHPTVACQHLSRSSRHRQGCHEAYLRCLRCVLCVAARGWRSGPEGKL